jgi:ribonucleoside-diphosphate reductase alpha chain
MSERIKLPHRRKGIRFTIGSGALAVQVATGEYENGKLGEVFLDTSKEGSFSRAMLAAFAIALSIGLQSGVSLEAYAHTLRDFKMEPDILRELFKELEDHYGK